MTPLARYVVCSLILVPCVALATACATPRRATGPDAAPAVKAPTPPPTDVKVSPTPLAAVAFDPQGPLAPHNELRRVAGAPALVWSDAVAVEAGKLADKSAAACNVPAGTVVQHSMMMRMVTKPIDGATLVAYWASTGDKRHRILDKNKQELGCAVGRCHDGRQLWLCMYGAPR